MTERKRPFGLLGGFGIAAVGGLMLTMEGEGTFGIGLVLLAVGALMPLFVWMMRRRERR